MKLDDLSRPPRIHRYAWRLLLGVCAGSLAFGFWTERKNVELTHTNAGLARYVTMTLDSLEAELAHYRALQSSMLDALTDEPKASVASAGDGG